MTEKQTVDTDVLPVTGELESLDTAQIMELLPHRPPCLMVDAIISRPDLNHGCGIKRLSADDWFFCGHFDGHPVLPKSWLLEIIAQVGATFVMAQPEFKGKYILMAGVDECTFGRAALPGEELQVSIEILSVHRGLGKVRAVCSSGEDRLAAGTFTFAVKDWGDV